MTEVTEFPSPLNERISERERIITEIKIKAYDLIHMRQYDRDIMRRDACELALNILSELIIDLKKGNGQ